jgi:HK97 family phage portal protein
MARNPIIRALSAVGLWASDSAPGNAPDPTDWRMWGGVEFGSRAGQLVTRESGLQHDVVQAVLERMGGAIGQLPMMVMERVGDNGKRPATDHPLYKILHRTPNARQPHFEFFSEQERHVAWERNAYSRIVPDPVTGAPIGSLEILHPKRLQTIAMGPDGKVYYTFRRLDRTGQTDTWSEDEIWHVRKPPLTDNGLMGKAVYHTARETIGYAMAVREFGALYFKNGGGGGGIITHPSNFKTAEDRDAFLESFRSGSTGLNRHKDRLLLFGINYTPGNVKNDEAQFIESKREANVDVCRVWSMPPHMAGIMDKATFSNIEQQSIEFVIYTLGPDVAAWEQSASQTLLIGEDQDRYFIEINVNALLRGDFKTRYAGYALGRQWGFLSANDVRRFENLEPIGPDGDRYLVPMNMSPTGAPGADDETTDKPLDNPGGDPADNPADPQD